MKTLQNPEAQLIINKFNRQIPNEAIYQDRLKHELKIIIKMRFTKYILQAIQVVEIIRTITTQFIIRGSAGSSLVVYLLGISNFDPIIEKISFARFLNVYRMKGPPDIDIDVAYNLRQNIFSALHQELLEYDIARISNHVNYKPKSATREAIRQIGYRHLIKNRELDSFLRNLSKEEKRDLEAYKKQLLGKMRCYSLHVGGVVLFEEAIPEELRLESKTHNQIILNKDQVAERGMLKMDILSNRGLAIFRDLAPQKDITDYPHDAKVFRSLLRNNIGITFAESRTMNRCMHMIHVKNREELQLCLSLIRPMASASRSQLSDSRNTLAKRMEDLIIYDDDAITYIQSLIKCDEGVADRFRRSFAKNKKNEILQFEEIIKEYQNRDEILDNLTNLKEYSFCRSHACSYAILCYALAYEKYHNPKTFWLSTLNHANSSYRKYVHFREAVAVGIDISQTFSKSRPWRLEGDVLLSQKQPKIKKIKPQKPKPTPKMKAKKKAKPAISNTDIRTFLGIKIEKEEDNMSQNTPETRPEITPQPEPEIEISQIKPYVSNPLAEYRQYGYWASEAFLPGMYFAPIHNDPEKVKFRGLIAQGRVVLDRTQKAQKLTFITIGIDNNRYIDLTIDGSRAYWLFDVISGTGKMTVRHNIVSVAVETSHFENL